MKIIKKRYIIPLFILLIVSSLVQTGDHKESEQVKTLKCLIISDSGNRGKIKLSAGFNYEMLNKFAGAINCKKSIKVIGRKHVTEAILRDSFNLISIKYDDSLYKNSEEIISSMILADSSVWITKNKMIRKLSNQWLSHFRTGKEYKKIKAGYSHSYDHFVISDFPNTDKFETPYDDIVQKHAGRLGWDRYLLSALILQESRFRIEVESPRGAKGLMQIMPVTYRNFGNGNIIDPECNIRAGTDYLIRIKNNFKSLYSEPELTKICLAAYNAGEGKIIGCINYAKTHGLNYSSWEDIKSIMKLSSDDNKAEERFIREETIAYVDKIFRIYDAIRPTSRSQFSQDRPSTQKDTAKTVLP